MMDVNDSLLPFTNVGHDLNMGVNSFKVTQSEVDENSYT